MRISWLAVFAVCMSLCQFPAQQAAAEANYPSRSILIIIAASTGGGTDLSSRVLADALEPLLGQKIGILNKPGGGGAEGLVELAKAAPDGYTLGAVFNGPLTAAPHIKKPAYSLDSFAFVASTFEADYMICARKDLPATGSAELVQLLRQKPLAYTYGTDGKGSSAYFAAEGLFDALGVVQRSEGFKGSTDAVKNLFARKADFYIGTVPPILPQIGNGEAKCPIVLGNKAPAFAPGAATPAALGAPGKEATLWRMILAPKGLAEDRAGKLQAAIGKAMASPAVQAFLAAENERAAVKNGPEVEARLRQEFAVNGEIADRLLLATEQPDPPANLNASNKRSTP